MALIITRFDDISFSFQLDGGALKIDNQPDLTTFTSDGVTLCDWKTKNGANLYQRINLTVIQLVDTFGGTGTFNYSDPLLFWAKARELKLIRDGNGTAMGATALTDLSDVFVSYFGNPNKVLVINNAQNGITQAEYRLVKNTTDLDDMPVKVGSKLLGTDASGEYYVYYDLPTEPQDYINSYGWVIYENALPTPQTYVSGLMQLENDTLGGGTDTNNAPFGINNLWDNVNNVFDFSDLEIGDTINFIADLDIETFVNNKYVRLWLRIADGTASEVDKYLGEITYSTLGTYKYSVNYELSILNNDYKNAPALLLLESDDLPEVYLSSLYIKAVRKDINTTIVVATDDEASHNKGNYNVTTNTPTLSNGSGQIGDYYTLITAGTRDFGAGNITFGIGDRIEYNGGIWFKAIDNSQGMGALDNTADHDKGDYNATTNTPTLIDGTGQIGDYYKVSVAGTVDLGSGNIILQVNDIIGYDGSIWYKKVNNNQNSGVTSIDTLSGVQTLGGITASLTEKVTIVDNDLIGGADSEASNASKKWKFSTIATYVLGKLGAYLFALTAKTTPVDADTITINDTEDSNVLKKLSFTNLKAFLKTYFDTLYISVALTPLEVVLIQNRWTLTNNNVYYRSRGDFSAFNDSTSLLSTGISNFTGLTTAIASNSGFLYWAHSNKKLHSFAVDFSLMPSSNVNNFSVMLVACERIPSSNVNTGIANLIDLGEYSITKTSTDVTFWYENTAPNNVTIPAGYIVTAMLKRTDGTTAEVNCSMYFKFKDA